MHPRAFVHYLFIVGVLTIYGGRVCPFVEGLGIISWLLILVIAYGAAFLVRWKALAWVAGSPFESRSRRQFWLEFVIFLATGSGLMLYNHLVHGFPLGSGLKVIVGGGSLGFFAAAELSLKRERLLAVQFKATGRELDLSGRIFPLTGKFVVMAAVCAFTVTAVIFLVISKDLYWIIFESQGDIEAAQRSVLIEVGFVAAVLLLEVLMLVVSYSKNLNTFFRSENGVLEEVAGGSLDARVPVASRDEFGVMARYTNHMIGALRRRTEELQLTQDVTILTLASLAETRDNETGAHILRTRRYVLALAEHLKDHPGFREVLDPRTVDLLYKSAPLHDVGKVGVRDAILLKPGRLDPEEFEEMKKHTIYGRDSLQTALDRLGESSFLKLAQEIAFTHHEKWDGGGYPRGLAGPDIPVSGRLMALADVYDALISRRVYKPAFPHEKAKGIILEGQGTHFDPDVVDAFLAVEDQFLKIAGEFADH